MAGKDSTRGVAKMSLDPADLTHDTVSQILSLCLVFHPLGHGLLLFFLSFFFTIAKLPN